MRDGMGELMTENVTTAGDRETWLTVQTGLLKTIGSRVRSAR